MKIDVVKLDAGKAGSVELNADIFGIAEIRADLLQRCVKWQLSRRQAGTHKTKERSEIARTKKKMYKQKGTGGARHGARSAPIFVGGGVAHGPRVRSHATDLPKKVRALALRHALSAKAGGQQLIVLDEARLDAPKTRELADRFAKLGLTNALIIDGETLDENFARAARNLPRIDVLPAQGLNVYDVLRRDTLVLTRAALDKINERLAPQEAA
ncbi:50S ribosomal protein L4 [Alkalicaulis satelles]|uniref:Large ribosomal subunit protein uL4 n=1 Tax=Alkalicaulis satelles TaxID=2609175 RepID=A0A5M6ZA12_9PROT|nr:50S ribosomal protein L4 [Alkalicaulis satelles]KAA5801523.1 50S ribosomal protein L4 [Alkalicaulis satelles]